MVGMVGGLHGFVAVLTADADKQLEKKRGFDL